jgi:hypothetical protein
MILLISYDLKVPGRDYEGLYETIKTAGAWWHYLESTWLVKTDEDVDTWNEKLLKNMDDNDRLFIVDITNQKNNGWLPQKAWDWINKHNTA